MNRSSIVVVAALVLCGTCPALGQFYGPMGAPGLSGNIEGFTVTGKGSVSAKPNRLEIDMEVSASSELSADAIVKFRDAKKRIQDAFVGLKLGNVTVEERGLLVDQKGEQMNRYFFDGMPNRRNKTEVQLTRRLVVKCGDIRKMDEEALLQLVARLLDVAQDAGGKVGPKNEFNPYYYNPYSRMNSGLVRFILDDYDKLEEDAYAKAVADAGSRAKKLALMSGVKLGPVTAIRVATSPAERETNQEDEPQHKRLESSRFQEIPVRVELVVRFDVAPSPSAEGRPGVK